VIEKAKEAGYVAAFTMERRPSNISDDLMALPRYLMIDTIEKNRDLDPHSGKSADGQV
jgi:hypothetical protein